MSGSVDRARRLIARPGAWLDETSAGKGYALRLGPGRRHRPIVTLDEATYRALVEAPGLRRRSGGGWETRAAPVQTSTRERRVGAPGRILGERTIMERDGSVRTHRANLAQSPIEWLARLRDANGDPWLTPAEIAAGLRLGRDAERAMAGPSLTMRWDALPRSGGGSASRAEPGDRSIGAGQSVSEALAACGPTLAPFLVQICIRETALETAEREAGVAPRAGKSLLKAGLAALARHYGVG